MKINTKFDINQIVSHKLNERYTKGMILSIHIRDKGYVLYEIIWNDQRIITHAEEELISSVQQKEYIIENNAGYKFLKKTK